MGIIVPDIKKINKIKFACHWDDSENLASRVERNWGKPPSGIEIVTEGEFDYLISFNNSEEMFRTPKEKNIVFTMEPNWSPCINDKVLDHSFKIFSSVDRFANNNNVEMCPSLMFAEDTGGSTAMNVKQGGPATSKRPQDYLLDNNFDKNKKCSIILASHGAIHGVPTHQSSLYHARESLLVKILQSDLDIDIYGRNWSIDDKRYKGFAPLKEDALSDYEFSISIENSREDYYISEKITDCFMNNCVPIYDGCNKAEEFYDERSFERIDILKEDVIEDIKSILSRSNQDYKDFVINSKIKYFTDYNIYSYLERCIDIK